MFFCAIIFNHLLNAKFKQHKDIGHETSASTRAENQSKPNKKGEN